MKKGDKGYEKYLAYQIKYREEKRMMKYSGTEHENGGFTR